MEEYDILIKDGIIVDGKGSPRFKGSIGIRGDRIVSVGEVRGDAKLVIEASNLIVAPGFIDVHSHADKTLPIFPKAESYVYQGITTTIGGNCGNTIAPILEWWPPNMFWDLDLIFELKPFKYYNKGLLPAEDVKSKVREVYGVEISWGLFGEFLGWLENHGISVNHVPLVGHNTIRAEVMGEDWEREPTSKELEEMKELVVEAMEAGAFGLSTGLDYVPGVYSETREIVELVKVVRRYGGIYATHWRRTGLRRERTRPITDKLKGIIEAVTICREVNITTQISHITSGYTINPPPSRELLVTAVKETIRVIEEAVNEGLDVYFDIIPNVTGGTMTTIYLGCLLAPWVREVGSLENLSRALRMEDFREEVKSLILAGKWWGLNPNINPYWDSQIEITEHKNVEYLGRTIKEIADKENLDSIDTLFKLIIEDANSKFKNRGYRSEDEIVEFLKHPRCMIGLDTYAFNTKWEMKIPPYNLPHPNTYGGMPRYFRRYVREFKILSLEEAVKRITSLPAGVFKLKGRGVIEEGAYADITIFNIDTISDVEDPIEPRKLPKGVEYVIVNGEVVIEKGRHTGARPGRILRLKNLIES